VNAKGPVFVVGYPRSGTTLLLHILMSSGEFPTYTFTETHFFSHYYRRFGRLSNRENRKKFTAALYASNWFQRSGVTVEQVERAVESDRASYESYFGAIMDLLAMSQGKQRWLEKTPWHMLYVPEIRRAFPNAKLLLIVRDPRDVVLSIEGYGWKGGVWAGPVRRAIAWKWHMSWLHRILRRRDTDWLLVKYEDLVGNTAGELARINEFLGLSITAEALTTANVGVVGKANSAFKDASPGISTTPVGRWRDKLPPNVLAELNHVLAGLLRRYSYELPDLPSPSWPSRLRLLYVGSAYALAQRARLVAFPLVRR
jgi:hypothetical protein